MQNNNTNNPSFTYYPKITYLEYPTKMYKYDYEYDNENGNGELINKPKKQNCFCPCLYICKYICNIK